jgi:hypothetical protein
MKCSRDLSQSDSIEVLLTVTTAPNQYQTNTKPPSNSKKMSGRLQNKVCLNCLRYFNLFPKQCLRLLL